MVRLIVVVGVMTGESSPVAMDVRIHVPTISCDGISEIVVDTIGTVDSGTGRVVTGCVAGWDVQPASMEVRMTRVIKRTTGTEFFLHGNILIPSCQDNYQVSCYSEIASEKGRCASGFY
jgi:hypothetical protein